MPLNLCKEGWYSFIICMHFRIGTLRMLWICYIICYIIIGHYTWYRIVIELKIWAHITEYVKQHGCVGTFTNQSLPNNICYQWKLWCSIRWNFMVVCWCCLALMKWLRLVYCWFICRILIGILQDVSWIIIINDNHDGAMNKTWQ